MKITAASAVLLESPGLPKKKRNMRSVIAKLQVEEMRSITQRMTGAGLLGVSHCRNYAPYNNNNSEFVSIDGSHNNGLRRDRAQNTHMMDRSGHLERVS